MFLYSGYDAESDDEQYIEFETKPKNLNENNFLNENNILRKIFMHFKMESFSFIRISELSECEFSSVLQFEWMLQFCAGSMH